MSKLIAVINDLLKIRERQQEFLPFDNIIFNLRCRGLKKMTLKHLYLSVFVNLSVIPITTLLFFPVSLIQNYKSLTLSFLVSLIPFAVFDLIKFSDFILLIFVIWALLNIKSVTQMIFLIGFEIGDILTGLFFSKKYLDIYLSLSIDTQRNFLDRKRSPFATYFFKSRQILRTFKEAQWEDYFTNLALMLADESSIHKEEVEKYWDSINSEGNEYISDIPMPLNEHLVFATLMNSRTDWKKIRRAHMKVILNNMDDINKLSSGPGNKGGITAPFTILSHAVLHDAHLDIVKEILDAGADVNFPQPVEWISDYFFSILHCAVSGSSRETVKFLLDNGLDIKPTYEKHRYNIATWAVINAKDPDTINEILLRSDRNLFSDSLGNNLFHYVAVHPQDKTDIMKSLLQFGLDINEKNNRGVTPIRAALKREMLLMEYFFEGDVNLKNTKFFIENGADINELNEDKETLLHTVANTNHQNFIQLVDLLLEAGCDINKQNKFGNTSLHLAVSNCSPKEIFYLLEKGIDIKLKNSDDLTAFDLACRRQVSNNTEFYHANSYIEILEKFLELGVDPFILNMYGRPPLFIVKSRLRDVSLKQKGLGSKLKKVMDKYENDLREGNTDN